MVERAREMLSIPRTTQTTSLTEATEVTEDCAAAPP